MDREDRHITTMLTAEHAVNHFSCGVGELDRYIIRYALRNQTNHLAVTYVLTRPPARPPDAPSADEVVGYYSLAMSHVAYAEIPEKHRNVSDPKYAKPTVLLAKLAVHSGVQKQRFGEKLLVDAMRRASKAAAQVAAVALEVHALTDEARSFYLKYGFIQYLDNPKHLFLQISTIDDLLGGPGI